MKGRSETTIRTLFAFNGFVVLLAIQSLLLSRVASISWLHGVLGTAAWHRCCGFCIGRVNCRPSQSRLPDTSFGC